MPVEVHSDKFTEYIMKQQEAKLKAATKALEYVGLKSVAEMRQRGRYNDYTDRTGNLRSSTGFAVVRDGKMVAGSAFTAVSGSEGIQGTRGSSKGKAHAKAVVSTFSPTKLGLIVVAGMEYAEHLDDPDNPHGRNVMKTTKQLAKKEAERLLTNIGFKVTEV